MSSRKGWHLIFFMEHYKTCSFFGHREITLTNELYAIVKTEIVNSVLFGCRIFYFGGYGEFDRLCYSIVTELKKEYTDIKRIYCVPQEWHLRKSVKFFNPDDYDDVIYLELKLEWWYKSIYYRNCAMIDASDYVIFYAEERENSGAYKAYKYAKRTMGKTIANLWHNT